MTISNAGLNLIKQFEGLRLKSYLCPAGVLTIGYGSTQNVKANQTITEAEAELLLMKDLIPVENAIARLVTVPLKQCQYDSLCALIFNIGIGAFKRSTLLRFLNEELYYEASLQFARWNNVNGVESKGLTKRRKAEMELFCSFNFNAPETSDIKT